MCFGRMCSVIGIYCTGCRCSYDIRLYIDDPKCVHCHNSIAVDGAGLILNENKCQLITNSVDFLGFHVTDKGISPNKKPVQ